MCKLDHYTKSLPYELELTSRVLHEAARCFFEQHKFSISQEEFIILDCLYMYPGIIQIELAKLIMKGRAHTGKFLKSLEQKGLIARTPKNQGSKIIMESTITAKGLEIYKTISNALDQYISESSTYADIDVQNVIKILQLIRDDAIKKFNIKFN